MWYRLKPVTLAGLTGCSLAITMMSTTAHADKPVKIIFDTDFQTDCDDAGALAVLHALADAGEADILATIVSAKNAWSVAAVDVVNTYYGRPAIPVGALKGPGVLLNSPYTQTLAENFPHDTAAANAPDAVAMYRELLAAQPDSSVTLMTVGYATNLRDLLASGPDQLSPLSGRDLVAQKVTKWVNMGGNFENRRTADGFPYDMNTTNVNWERDAQAAITAITDWPTEIVYVGREIGHSMRAGDRLDQTPQDNPVRAAYEAQLGSTRDHHLADLSTVLYAVRGLSHGEETYWAQEFGQIEMRDGAKFDWAVGADGDRTESRIIDAYTDGTLGLMSPAEIQELIEDLMIQTPRGADLTGPTTPGNATATASTTLAGRIELSWQPANETDTGSWVAGYNIYRDGELAGLSIGTNFVDRVPTAGEHQYSIAAINASGTESDRLDLTGTSNGSAGHGNGLKGEYFNNITLSGEPAHTRTDEQIAFSWGSGSPDGAVNADGFSVRWSGLLQAAHVDGTQTYTLTTLSNDGVRLWVDSELLIDKWVDGANQVYSADVELVAGRRYDIVLEYYENTNTSRIELRWETTGLDRELIPTERLYSTPEPTSAAILGVGGLAAIRRRRNNGK